MKTWSNLQPAMLGKLALAAIVFAAAGAIGADAAAARAGRVARAADSRQALLAADRTFVEATARANKNAEASLLDSRFTWTNRDGKTWTRAQALAAWKRLAPTAGGESGFDARVYGRVGVVSGMGQVGNNHVRFGRIWIEEPAGWKLMVYQENPVMAETAAPTPAAAVEKGPATCINPCKEVPYEPKTAAAHRVIASWQALETANFSHDAEGWAEHVSNDFMLIRPSGGVLDKADRMATIRHQKADSIVVHVPTAQWVRVWMFGSTAVMIARHHLDNGAPYRATRVWVLHHGVWQLALSQQTIIQ